LAIQLAKWSGAKVIATGRPTGFDRIYNAGADVVLDYQDPELASQILSHAPNGVDRAVEVEFGENIDLLHQVVRPLGTIATYGSAKNMVPQMNFGPLLFKALKIDISLIYILPMADRLARIQEINTAHADGMFKPDIDQIFDLADTWQAHDATLSAGRKGAILIQV
jgi:NADPH2:quinone reductase